MANKLFIIDNGGVSSLYGIGTYVRTLVNALENSNLEIVIVELFSPITCVKIISNSYCTYLYFPDWKQKYKFKIDYESQYLRNVVAYLAIHYDIGRNDAPIFHLNFVDIIFIKTLKRYFNCSIVLTIHFAPWDFVYKGNEQMLWQIWHEKHKLDNNKNYKVIKQLNEYQQSFVLCDKIICLTQKRKVFFMRMFNVDSMKYVVIPNALNNKDIKYDQLEKKCIKKKLLQNSDVKIVLSVGRLDVGKNIEVLIKCYKRTLHVYPNSHLVIVGSGNYEQLFRIIDLEAIDKISFVGFLDRKKLMEIYSIADIGVMCSAHEEFGYVAVEMMMNSIPIIVSESLGISEFLDDCCIRIPLIREDGAINENMLTKFLLELLTDSDLYNQKAVMVKRKYDELFDIALYRIKMLDLYNSLF